MQYPCILGIDFMSHAKISFDFFTKSLIIPDSQIEKVTISDEPVQIDLSNTKLNAEQKQKLQILFKEFQGLFSVKPGLTHVFCHEIDTGDNPPVFSRPYRYDRVKQGIIIYMFRRC
ncbi:hypothetical protein TNCT_230281 [Trichonephila clavata]|uniref:Uncharacterized protein n=1 Tax=Trichonephila clavata TaxID=2740835 RepID=A0A8X6LVP3_TRICU|nr:hypothetical protein TNCT_230281 [Trichonephila clavata]